jgi:hypothetical protein
VTRQKVDVVIGWRAQLCRVRWGWVLCEGRGFLGQGREQRQLGEDLRGWEFLNWDFLIWDEGFEWWVLKGREGGPVFFVELLTAEGFLG